MCTIKAYNTAYDIRNVYSTVYDLVSYAKHELYKRSVGEWKLDLGAGYATHVRVVDLRLVQYCICTACVSADLDPSRFWIPYDVTHCLGICAVA